jgi:hypothetical protein
VDRTGKRLADGRKRATPVIYISGRQGRPHDALWRAVAIVGVGSVVSNRVYVRAAFAGWAASKRVQDIVAPYVTTDAISRFAAMWAKFDPTLLEPEIGDHEQAT